MGRGRRNPIFNIKGVIVIEELEREYEGIKQRVAGLRGFL